MANGATETHRHFILEGFTDTETYRARAGGGGGRRVPARNREEHAATLGAQLGDVRTAAQQVASDPEDPEDGFGIQVEFQSFPDIDLAFESLSRENQGIELRNVRHRDDITYATVYVPTGKLEHFEGLIRDYLDRRQDSIGRPRDNQRLLDAIQAIRAASVRALWTDDDDSFPEDDTEPFACEIWLPAGRDRKAGIGAFRERAASLGMQVSPGELLFPERSVLVARTSLATIQQSIATLNSIAELRRAKETADFFDALTLEEQSEWLDHLLERTSFNGGPEAPYVCLLDTGINRGHPLISPILDAGDLHTVEPAWGTTDDAGHGTEMAGLAIAGNLTEVLDRNDDIEVEHRLESVKLLRDDGANGTDSRHHGYLTAEAVSRPEIDHPERPRVFGMAVTARDNRDRGRPTGWSAAIDALAADSDNQGETPRLLVVSAGNVKDNIAWKLYPDSNDSDGIHDPAQAWNALTVGAYTNLTRITEPDAEDFDPIAPRGGLSPFSTTALGWQGQWPLKPDVVLEGGNAAADPLGAVTMPSLSLITTHHEPANRLFTTTNATSAATALAARMAAPDHGHLSRTLARDSPRVDRPFGSMDLRHEAGPFAPRACQAPLPPTRPAVRIRRPRPRTRALDRRKLPYPSGPANAATVPEGTRQTSYHSRHASPPPTVAARRPAVARRDRGRDAYHALVLHRAQSVPAGQFPLSLSVPRAAVRRQASDRDPERLPRTDQRCRPARATKHRHLRSPLAPRCQQPPSGFAAFRHLARYGRRARKQSPSRRLSDDRLVAYPRPARLRQPYRPLRPGRQHSRSRHRRGPLHRSGQCHHRFDPNVNH